VTKTNRNHANPEADDFFISYTRSDERWAVWIAGELEDVGISVTVQAWDFRPGMNFVAEMQRAAATCKRTLVVLSPAYMESRFCTDEWTAAFVTAAAGKDAKLVPVRVKRFQPPGLWAPIVYIDLADKDEAAARRALLDGIERGRQKRKGGFPGPPMKGSVERASVSDTTPQPFPAALPPVWTVPIPPNPHFKGRQSELCWLRERLSTAEKMPSRPLVLHGLGGVGKTQIAVEYAWQERAQYDAVLWVEGDTPENLHANVAALAGPLGLGLDAADTPEESVRLDAVIKWLRQHRRWLLLLDNLDTRAAGAAAMAVLRRAGWGNAVFTSRRGDWDLPAETCEIRVLSDLEATELLLERTPGSAWSAECANRNVEAASLAKELGLLPLAIEQAAAYLRKHRLHSSEYMNRFSEARNELLEYPTRGGTDLQGERMAIASTWRTTKSELGTPARVILRFLAFIAPVEVPRQVFSRAPKTFLNALAKMAEETSQGDGSVETHAIINGALGELAEYSFIQLTPATLSCHQLVMAAERDLLGPPRAREWMEIALGILWEAAEVSSAIADDRIWQTLRPHVASIVRDAQRLNIFEPTTALMNALAVYLDAQALWSEAEPLLRRALIIDEATFGPDHPATACSLNNLALLLQDTNRFADAEPLMRRALAIDEAAFGPDHLSVAIKANSLGTLMLYTNRLSEAESLMGRALRISEFSLGANHPVVAGTLSNLAQVMKETNRPSEAKSLMRRALCINEMHLGSDHPTVAINLGNLAALLRAGSEMIESESLMRRALTINENCLGGAHPATARSLNNLALLLQDTNRFAEAEPLLRRALTIDEASLGPDHPSVAVDLNNLATLLYSTNRMLEAEPLMRRALEITETSLGPTHRSVAISVNNLAQLLQATGRPADAETLMRRALVIDEAGLGPSHPRVASDLNNLAHLLEAMGRSSEAESLMRRALTIDEASLGADHPNLAVHLNNLALLLETTGRSVEAEPLMRRALRIGEEKLGDEHPRLCILQNNLQRILETTNGVRS
jgi:tetratricopeptide (TPR) repeat protein